jgi:hypothetical protein
MRDETLRAELANALHEDWCGCDSWDGANCDAFNEGEFQGQADAVMPILARVGAKPAACPAPPGEPRERDELWSILDWSFWGSGMADTFREPLADKMCAAISDAEHEQAMELIERWKELRGIQAYRELYEKLRAQLAERDARIEALEIENAGLRARAEMAEGERDKANRDNESLARRLHLRFQNEQALEAQLAERDRSISDALTVPRDDARMSARIELDHFTRTKPMNRAAHEMADVVRALLDWCDLTEEGTRSWLKTHNPDCECEVGETTLEMVSMARSVIEKAIPASELTEEVDR